MTIVRVTGTETIVNADPNVANITVSEGKVALSDYTLDHVYKLQGDVVVITSGEATVITVRTFDSTYTFVINNTTISNEVKTVNVTAS